MSWHFTIPGPPVPKERPRFGKGRTYTPKKTTEYALKVRLCALAAGVKRLIGPVAITMEFYVPDRRRRDRDNLEKAIQDALNGIAWEDDSQVVQWRGWLEVDRKNPRARVWIDQVPEWAP